MNLAGRILRMFGWTVTITVPDSPRCLICVAPHTSNWDFIIGKLAYASVGRHAGFLMKDTWFFPPLGWIFRGMGGIPVPRGKKGGPSLTERIVAMFRDNDRLQLAITPEGTRSRTSRWHTGFLHIAWQAGIPIQLGVLDFATRTVTVTTEFTPTGDVDSDMARIKNFYRATGARGRRPENFSTDLS